MTYLGMCCLGVFVGAILALGLDYFKDKSSYLQLSVAMIAAALSGTVVGFFDYLARQGPNPGLYTYPIGLLLAVLWYYVRVADANINDASSRAKRVLGWSHLVCLVLLTVLAIGLVIAPAVKDVYNYVTSPVRVFYVNGFHLEFDGNVSRLKVNEEEIEIVREPAVIRISKGMLKVGNEDYGKVKVQDHISVLDGRVFINDIVANAAKKETDTTKPAKQPAKTEK